MADKTGAATAAYRLRLSTENHDFPLRNTSGAPSDLLSSGIGIDLHIPAVVVKISLYYAAMRSLTLKETFTIYGSGTIEFFKKHDNLLDSGALYRQWAD